MRRRFHGLGVVASGLLTAACSGDLSTLDPAGPAAESIALLWWIMLGGAVTIFLATSLVVVGAYVPATRHLLTPRLLIVWGGIAIPSIILIALVSAAFIQGERLIPRPQQSAPLRIEVGARNFSWTFRYPGGDASTLDTLHIPVGRDIDIVVTSSDVIHSFWVPRLGGKIDAIPGHTNVVRLRADRPGSYGGLCAEFCGDGHTDMRFRVIAHEAGGYEAAIAQASGHAP